MNCESGDFSHCYLNETEENVPIGCEGVFMFSDIQHGCESLCEQNDKKRSDTNLKKKGWTNFMNADKPINTSNGKTCNGTDWLTSQNTKCEVGKDDACCKKGSGDHEHLFYFQNNIERDRLKVYQSDGTVFDNCEKKAIHVHEQNTHDPWWELTGKYSLARMTYFSFS